MYLIWYLELKQKGFCKIYDFFKKKEFPRTLSFLRKYDSKFIEMKALTCKLLHFFNKRVDWYLKKIELERSVFLSKIAHFHNDHSKKKVLGLIRIFWFIFSWIFISARNYSSFPSITFLEKSEVEEEYKKKIKIWSYNLQYFLFM